VALTLTSVADINDLRIGVYHYLQQEDILLLLVPHAYTVDNDTL
jgi:hypothetical protein